LQLKPEVLIANCNERGSVVNKMTRASGTLCFGEWVALRLLKRAARLCLRSMPMLDVLFIAITVVFFLIAGVYVIGCDKL
jgi:hypothetical protein